MTKEQFLTLYKAFVLLGQIKTSAMSPGANNDVRNANSMVWHVLSGCCEEKSIFDYANEIGVSEDELDAAVWAIKS